METTAQQQEERVYFPEIGGTYTSQQHDSPHREAASLDKGHPDHQSNTSSSRPQQGGGGAAARSASLNRPPMGRNLADSKKAQKK